MTQPIAHAIVKKTRLDRSWPARRSPPPAIALSGTRMSNTTVPPSNATRPMSRSWRRGSVPNAAAVAATSSPEASPV